MMSFRSECTIFLKVPPELKTKKPDDANNTLGEVDSGSILNKKEETKSYWETKMLATVDDNGWEPVANVKFRTETQNNNVEESANTVPPPPEFSADSGNSFESLSSREDFSEQQQPPAPQGVKNERPARQYVYGADEENKNGLKTGSQTLKIASSHENIIEAEIREQQLREEELRRENDLRNREKTGGASSPSSHTSDEGFVDRPIEEVPSPPLTSSSPSDGFTHTLKGSDGEAIIYDAVSPPSDYFTEKPVTPNGSTSEAKIALEIRELKEREAELRAIRELREREQHLRTMRDCISEPRSHPAEVEEENEEVERVSSSSREILEDHLTSLTTTTDEGNFSECGDPGSSEDKSSDGSNSRIMSPDLHSFGSHAENRQRKVTVKPFEDDDSEAQPVYTQMKKESVIEREIRLAKEREEAFRREKGLTIPPSPSTPKSNRVSPALQSPQPSPVTNSNIVNGEEKAPKNAVEPPKNEVEPPKNEVEPPKQAIEPPKRGVQHRLATSRIQQEIEETSQRERELRNAGKILTLSEDTVDSKVTRLSDFVTDQESTTPRASSISSVSSFSSLNSSPSRGTLPNAHTPLNKRNTSPLSNFSSPYSPPTFTPSPSNRPPTPTRLTRSFSTNNLSLSGTHPGGLRAPQKGLMQKFIASRGKMTGSAFAPPTSPTSTLAGGKPPPTTANGIPTRPMRVSPKAPVVRREIENKTEDQQQSKIYRRTHATAEEKIQEELREMKKREEELRRLRARNLARSQPNLAGIDDDVDEEELTSSEGVDSSSFLHEVNGLRTALSNPNLLDDESEQTTQAPQTERGVRRRSALIAQWEGRIQQTAET